MTVIELLETVVKPSKVIEVVLWAVHRTVRCALKAASTLTVEVEGQTLAVDDPEVLHNDHVPFSRISYKKMVLGGRSRKSYFYPGDGLV